MTHALHRAGLALAAALALFASSCHRNRTALVDDASTDTADASTSDDDGATYGILKMIADAQGGDPSAPTAPWGRDDTMGWADASAIGASDARAPAGMKLNDGAMSVNGRLPPEVVKRIVRQHFGVIRACYDKALQTNPKLTGRVSVKFVIDTHGDVASAADAGSDLPDTKMIACVVGVFAKLSFPQPEGGIVTVVYPIVFRSAS